MDVQKLWIPVSRSSELNTVQPYGPPVLSAKIDHASTTQAGTCPFPIALSLAALFFFLLVTLLIDGSTVHQSGLHQAPQLVLSVLVQPMGQPISHSTHSGFSWPPSSAITQ